MRRGEGSNAEYPEHLLIIGMSVDVEFILAAEKDMLCSEWLFFNILFSALVSMEIYMSFIHLFLHSHIIIPKDRLLLMVIPHSPLI